MLVTFTTDVHANISMFEGDALIMLKMMGHSATFPGAILAADVPAALSRLTAAIAAKKFLSPVENENDDTDEPVVGMTNRGLPLIGLLTDAAKAGCNVMWNK